MKFSIQTEDPDTADVLILLQDGEAYAAALYAVESDHLLSTDALRADNVRFIVARDDIGRAVGTGAIAFNDDWAEIKRMWVAPGSRGKGLSKAILADLTGRALEAGIGTLRLETGNRNSEALALYEGSGFSRSEAFGGYQAAAYSVFMEKKIA